MKKWFWPLLFAACLILLALLTTKHATQIYAFFLSPFGADTKWVGSHSKIISNVGHTVGFALLALVCRMSTLLRAWQVLAVTFALVVSIELVQAFIPYRSGRWDDVGFGGGGVLLGLMIYACRVRCFGLFEGATREH